MSRMQGKALPERSADAPVYVGIDVCKAWLDVYLHPVAIRLRVENAAEGVRKLKRVLAGHRTGLVVMEATAKYHRRAHRMLDAAGYPVAVVNPLRARLFAEALGVLAKTDRIDARMLAVMGESLKLNATPPPAEALQELQELVHARQAASAERTALANRLGASQVAFLRAELKRRCESLERHIARLNAEIERRLQSDPALMRRYAILLSVPGIGKTTAVALLVGLSELGVCSSKAAALLAGLAPLARDSGDKNSDRHIRGGRANVRKALYMAAVTAARFNPDLAAFYARLRAIGKPAKLALTAVMRKLVVLANSLLREDRPWLPIRA